MGLDFGQTKTAKTAKQRMMSASNTKDRIVELPIAKLHESPLNKNMPLSNIDTLAESIRQNGLQEPLLVYAKEDGTYEVYAGHRRLHATRDILKWKQVPCLSKPYPADESVRFKEHFINNAERRENSFRYWMAEIIEARNLVQKSGTVKNKRQQVEEVSELLDKKVSVAQIYRYEAVEKMQPCVLELADLGYSAYALSFLGNANSEQQKRFADIIKEKTLQLRKETGNDAGLLSQAEFLALLKAVQENNSEKKTQTVNKYESRLSKTENSLKKMFGKPRTEEDRVYALGSIIRMRTILDQIESELRSEN